MTDADKLNNAIEHLGAIIDDLRDIEPTTQFDACAIHGMLREISAETVTALVAIAAIQADYRHNGAPEDAHTI